ncbi:hypothetical protein CDAR_543831 [Caerostris darwini]|uniref:Uncharacterized protein n=1 Tax=Caerostris darwini TaxID=1538125 RepID=A0AAV4VMD1_9ARAC|nr:hypothetical protein CDAR_543831 [Caerostris darwini]
MSDCFCGLKTSCKDRCKFHATAIHTSIAFKRRIQSPSLLESESTTPNESPKVALPKSSQSGGNRILVGVHFPSSVVYFFATREENPCPRRLILFLGEGVGVEGKGGASPTPLEDTEFQRLIFLLRFFFCQSFRENYLVFLEEENFSTPFRIVPGKAMGRE